MQYMSVKKIKEKKERKKKKIKKKKIQQKINLQKKIKLQYFYFYTPPSSWTWGNTSPNLELSC